MVHRFYKFLLHHQVIFALFLIALGWLVFQTRGILTAVFISYIIMAALLPAVLYLQRRGFPKIVAVLIPYISSLIFILIIIFPLVPFFLSQVSSLISGLPEYLDQSAEILGIRIDPNQVQTVVSREFDSIGRNAFNVTRQVFGGVFSILTVLIISFYLLLYQENFKRSIARLFHSDAHNRVHRAISHINEKLGAWMRGQMVLSFSIGFITWVVLSILGVLFGMPYALPLALLAGILEVIPTLGPTLAAIPAVIVALTISPTLAIIVVLIYIIIQLLENNILVPKIMQRAVGLNPVIVILAVMIGANLMGIVGALLSIPFVSFIIVLFNSINNTEEPAKE